MDEKTGVEKFEDGCKKAAKVWWGLLKFGMLLAVIYAIWLIYSGAMNSI